MKVILTCAGTGGHINPAIAIANIIKKNNPDCDILFIGTKTGLENDLVVKAGYDIKSIRTGKFLRHITFKNIKDIFKILGGISDAKKIIKQFKPDIIIGTGGYICGPVMLAAKHFKIPYILHESNSYPGIAVKFLAKKAKYVFIGFKDAKPRLKNRSNIIYTGTPTKFTRQNIDKLDIDKCKNELDLSVDKIEKSKKIIFVTGGSQGAVKFNQVILDMVKTYHDKNIYIVLVTGQKNYNKVISQKQSIESKENINLDKYISIRKFVYDMDKMYKVADLCITRSGAMTINELIIASKPSILIPFPYATENHQLYNAQVLENLGAAEVILEPELTTAKLYNSIKRIVMDDKKLNSMSKSAGSILKMDTEQVIYKYILKAINEGD